MSAQGSSAGTRVVADLFARSNAAQWGLTLDQFRALLDASATHAFSGRTPSPADRDRYLAGLHVADLALAAACAAGVEPAWEAFILEYRPTLYRAADAIDPTGRARELADALYADLYGLRESRGARQSLFRYFHGRSSLATWLRAVLSQRLLDRVRADRRTMPLPEDDAAPATSGSPEAPDPARERYVAATSRALQAAIAGLDPRDRLRLGCYYVQRLTLAEIGRLLKEHEGSVSRHLTRVRGAIRDAIERHLRDREQMNEAEVRDCLQSVMDDAGAIDLEALVRHAADGPDGPTASPAIGKNVGHDRSRK